MIINLFRHGNTGLKSRGAYQGWLDEPLDPALNREAQAFDATTGPVYVSPLRRTQQSAAILYPCARQVVVEDLKEMNFGDFEGRSPDEMKDDPVYRAWVAGGCLAPCPNGEQKDAFCARTCAAFASLVDDALARGEEALHIVAHGGTQMMVMETFVDPSVPYYKWLLDCWQGWQLDTAPWKENRRLKFLGLLDFSTFSKPAALYTLDPSRAPDAPEWTV